MQKAPHKKIVTVKLEVTDRNDGMSWRYDDIINVPYHGSRSRTPMPVENRAAQFAPFAALTGHEDAISETARLTDRKLELTEETKREISRLLEWSLAEGKAIKLEYFIADSRKEGGEYRTIPGVVTKIDENEKILILDSGHKIYIDEIMAASIL